MIITNIKINIYLCKYLFIIIKQVCTCKGKLQGRNPKPNLFLQIKTFKLQSIYLDYFINKQLNYYRLVTVLSENICTDTT